MQYGGLRGRCLASYAADGGPNRPSILSTRRSPSSRPSTKQDEQDRDTPARPIPQFGCSKTIEVPTSRQETDDERCHERVAELAADETRFVSDSFDSATAWRLGTLMVERAVREDAAVIIDIRRPGRVLFRSALAGTTAENEAWLERKARTVFGTRRAPRSWPRASRLRASTPGRRHGSTRGSSRLPEALSHCVFHGVGLVAAITVSGLTSDEDHDFVVQSLTQYVDRQAAATANLSPKVGASPGSLVSPRAGLVGQ